MITPSHRRWLSALTTAAATASIAGVLGACSSSGTNSDARSTAPAAAASGAPADSEFCQLEAHVENRFGQVFAASDPSNPGSLVPALQSAATDIRAAARHELEIAPGGLHDVVAVLVAGVEKAAQGNPGDLQTDAFHNASIQVDSHCGLSGIKD